MKHILFMALMLTAPFAQSSVIMPLQEQPASEHSEEESTEALMEAVKFFLDPSSDLYHAYQEQIERGEGPDILRTIEESIEGHDVY